MSVYNAAEMECEPQAVCLKTSADKPGGVWRHMVELAVGLRQRGISVRVEVPPALQASAESHGLLGPRKPNELLHLHLADTYDLVLTASLLAARSRGQLVVITEHLPRLDASDPALASRQPRLGASEAKTAIKKLHYLLAAKVIVVSEGSAAFLASRYNPRPGLVTVVQNGVAPVHPADRREERPWPRVVASGSIIAQKGFDLLVEAAVSARRSWVVDVMGTGTHIDELRSRAAKVRLPDGGERVRFLGWSDKVDLEISRADALVVPSRWEASSYSALEAMALGRPVIATAVDGLSDIVLDGQTGLLVDPTPSALCAALDAFSEMSESARQAMGDRGLQRVRDHFTLDQMVDKTLATYRSLLDPCSGFGLTLIGPSDGGVSHVSRMLARHWPGTPPAKTVLVSDDASSVETDCECGDYVAGRPSPVAARAARAVWFHRRCLRNSTSVHVELGRTSVGALWFSLAAGLLLRQKFVLGAHDLPVVVHHPAAALIRQAPGWRDRIAYRVVAPLLDRPLMTCLRHRTAATVALSSRAASAARLAGWRNVTVAYHGASDRTAQTDPSAGAYVLLAGYLGPGKGLDVLAEAWQRVSSPLPLVIAGGFGRQDADWVGRVRARFDAGQNPPTWTGFVDDDQFDALIRDAAVVVLPYEQSNPASGVLVRALIEGRAVVATRVPAVLDEVDDDVSGLLVAPSDPAQLAAALRRVLSSAELRDRLGAEASRSSAARHSWSSHAGVIAAAHGLPGARSRRARSARLSAT